MRFTPVYGDALQVELGPHERVKAESDALVAMPAHFTVGGQMDGGPLAAFTRSFFSGESVFFQVIDANSQPGAALFAPVAPGTVLVDEVTPQRSIYMKKGAYLACGPNVDISATVQRDFVRGVFSGTGFFPLIARGNGPVAFSAYGTVALRELKPGEEWVVDTEHVLAWTEGTAFRVDLASRRSLWSSVTSGELLMCYFRGPGTVWMQTRNEKAFRQWLNGDGTQFRKSWSGVPALIILVLAVLIIGTVIGAALYSTQFNGY